MIHGGGSDEGWFIKLALVLLMVLYVIMWPFIKVRDLLKKLE